GSMTECWSTGDLRASIDRELPPETLGRIAAHLEGCGQCRALHEELARRGGRVAACMDALDALPQAPAAAGLTGHKRRWPVPRALAGGLAMGGFIIPKGGEHPRAVPPVDPAPAIAAVTPPSPEPEVVAPPRSVRPRRARPAPPRVQTVDFVALDDRP